MLVDAGGLGALGRDFYVLGVIGVGKRHKRGCWMAVCVI